MIMEVEPPAAEVTRTAAAVGGTEDAVEDAGGTDSMTRVAVSIPTVRRAQLPVLWVAGNHGRADVKR